MVRRLSYKMEKRGLNSHKSRKPQQGITARLGQVFY